ncbi:MAG: DUF2393 domain-containing protein [Sulfurimonas sp.]|nr:DUF2393 domain-containing protein [Sulfurimonas sp.]
MSTLFNVWHYLAFFIGFFLFAGGVFLALKQEKRSMMLSILFSITLITIVMSGMTVAIIDKYTKEAKLYKLENKRNLSTEQISFSGVVKNEGDYEIGEVTFEIKLVNQGLSSENMKAGTFYSPTGIMSFFGFTSDGSSKKENRPQQVTHEFVVAKNLKPGQSEELRVYFDYPPYFKSVSHFAKVYAH